MHICSSNELQAPACCRSFQIRNKSSWFCGSDLRLCRFQKLYRWDGWGLMLRLLSAPPGFNWWIYFAPVFKRWFIDKYGAFHANQTSMLPNPLHNWWRDWYSKTSLSPQAIFLLTVPRRCLFSGSFSLFVFFFVFANTRCLFVATLWSPVGEELTSWLSWMWWCLVLLSLSCSVSLVRCGTW